MDRTPYHLLEDGENVPDDCIVLPDGGLVRPRKENKIFVLGHADIDMLAGTDMLGADYQLQKMADEVSSSLFDDYEPQVDKKHFDVKAVESAITIRTSELLPYDVTSGPAKSMLAALISRLITDQLAQEKSTKPEWVLTEKIEGCYSWTNSSKPGSIPPISSLKSMDDFQILSIYTNGGVERVPDNSIFTRRFNKDWIEVLPENIDIVDVHTVSDYGHYFSEDKVSSVTQDIECIVLWYNVEAKEEFSKHLAEEAIKDIQKRTREAIHRNLTPKQSRQISCLPENLSEAECKALRTLRDLISEKSYRRYITNGFIMVKGKDCYYQVFRDSRHTRVYQNNKFIKEICINTSKDCPPTDHVINLKLLIEFDEKEFWNSGNTHHFNPDKFTVKESEPPKRLVNNYDSFKQEWYG